MTSIQQLWSLGLGLELNVAETSDAVLRTVNFAVPVDTITKWVYDLFSNHYNYVYKYSIKPGYNFKQEVTKTSKVSDKISQYTATMLRFKSYVIPNFIEIVQKRTKTQLKLTQGVPGVTSQEFFAMDEDSIEEFSYGYLHDEDVLDFCEEDPDAELDKYAYVYVPVLDWAKITSKRAAAWNVFYMSHGVSPEINKIYGEKKLFKKLLGYENAYDYFDSGSTYILYVGKENVKCKIPGYKELSWDQATREMRKKFNYDRMFEIEGVMHKKEDVMTNAMLQSSVATFDQYFKEINIDTVEKEVENVKKVSFCYSEFEVNKEYDRRLKELESLINKSKSKKQETKSGKGAVEMEEFLRLFKLLQDSITLGEMTTPIKEHLRVQYSQFNFQEPLRLLGDLVTRSELNSLIPGYLDLLLDGKIRLSRKTKLRIVNYANLQIKGTNRLMKKKMRKLLFVVKALLSEVQECNFLENENLEFAATLDDLFDLDSGSDSDLEEIIDLIPDAIEDNISFDLEKIL